MDKDGYHGYDMSKLTSSNTALTFQKPQENNIVFYNTMGGQHTEVLRITKDGITANPDVLVDEAADAVIRALDGYIKNLTKRTWVGLTDEMIVAGGKALAKLHADTCGLDFDDVWKYYAEDHKADAKAAIEAAHGIKE